VQNVLLASTEGEGEKMIYFIQYGTDGPVKIGTVCGCNAKSVSHRLASLQGATPTKLRILGFCPGGGKEEILLHKEMRPFRVSGEWFALRKELVDLIKKLSILSEQDRVLHEETISIGELVKLIQDDFNLDIYYKKLTQLIATDKKIPSYKVFGLRRYKYDECREYFACNRFAKKESEGR